MEERESRRLEVDGVYLETCWIGDERSAARGPVLVLLHEGLGCISTWRDFPERLRERTGLPVFAFSRQGYGRSDPAPLPRPLTYLEDEGMGVLPAVLAAAHIRRAILIGHSDGGTIALVYAALAGTRRKERTGSQTSISAIVTLAAHVFNEPACVAGVRAARERYQTGDLAERLTRVHGPNAPRAFQGWCETWLDPAFRTWSIVHLLPAITTPVLAIQGGDDDYGSLAQVETMAAHISGPVRPLILSASGHAPHQDQRDKVLTAITEFISSTLNGG